MKPRQNGFEPNGILQAGEEGHVGSPSSVQGLKIGIPSGTKSFVLQVASTSAWASEVVGEEPVHDGKRKTASAGLCHMSPSARRSPDRSARFARQTAPEDRLVSQAADAAPTCP